MRFTKEYRAIIIIQIILLLIQLLDISNIIKISLNILMFILIVVYCIIGINREVKSDMKNKYPDLYKNK